MTEIKDLEPRLREGFKVNYSNIKKAVLKCELEIKEKESNEKCKRIFKELNIDLVLD